MDNDKKRELDEEERNEKYKEEVGGMIEYKEDTYWVISFVDTKEEFYREEILDDSGDICDYGKVLTFESKEEADKFMFDNTDSHNYDFYSKKITEREIEEYEEI